MSKYKEVYREIYQGLSKPCDGCRNKTDTCNCKLFQAYWIKRHQVLQAEMLHKEVEWIRKERETLIG